MLHLMTNQGYLAVVLKEVGTLSCVRGDGGVDWGGGNGSGEKCRILGFDLVEWPGFSEGLNLRSKRKRRVKQDTKVFTSCI